MPHASVPKLDYAQHPAYGLAFTQPSWGARLRALRAFLKGLTLVSLRWLTDFEHLPKPSGRSNKIRWMLCKSFGYLRLIAAQQTRRLLVWRRTRASSDAARAVLTELRGTGVLALELTESQRAAMRQLLEPHFARLAQRLEGIDHAHRKFDDQRLVLSEADDPEPYVWFRDILGQLGVLEAASDYLGRRVDVAHVVPQINGPDDRFWGHPFDDVGLPAQQCDYFHFDTAYNVVKLIVYVSEVQACNGPFSFVRGSHRSGVGFWDGLCRRANDYAGLSSTRRRERELFMALPRVLRRKAAFGPDVLDTHPGARPLLEREWVITSADGCCVVFDPQGVHRGGMVRSGERRVVSIMLAETPHVPGFA